MKKDVRASNKILRFMILRRDEGYQSLKFSSYNKSETSLPYSNAFFMSKTGIGKLFYTFWKLTEFSKGTHITTVRTFPRFFVSFMTFRVLSGNSKASVRPSVWYSPWLNII